MSDSNMASGAHCPGAAAAGYIPVHWKPSVGFQRDTKPGYGNTQVLTTLVVFNVCSFEQCHC